MQLLATQPGAWAVHLPPGVDPGSLDLLAEGSLPAAWARRWAADPDRPVLRDAPRRPEGEGEWVTRRQLDQASRRVAARLHRAGLRRGDRVLVSAGTSLDLVSAYVGALRLGLVVVPVNTAYREPEVAHIARDAEPRAAIVDRRERGEWMRRAAGGDLLVTGPAVDLPDPAPAAVDNLSSPHAASGSLVTGGPPSGGGLLGVRGEAAAPGVAGAAAPGPWVVRGLPELDAVEPGDPALLCYTSGTTGAPKGALLSHGNLLASAEAVRLAWRWGEHDRLLLALPLFHVHGLAVGLHGTLLAGGSAVLFDRFDAERVLDAVRQQAATLFFGVPTMYARLAASPRVAELGALRLCVSGSAPLPPVLFERLATATGQRVLERYGMTETLMNVSNPYEGERRPGTVGLPLPGVRLRLTEGDHGEILFKGPNVFGGYWRNPDATKAVFDDAGWLRSGDLGSLDQAGYLRIEGRSKELIITGGYNVYPREVEEVLLAHPAVAEVAVVGAPSEEWGEVVTAYVVCDGPRPSEEELAAFTADKLAPFKRPRQVRYVDTLPRNALGKVLKHELGR
jgi:malonyl-CoA/methylmalonyl-CoA synthetase